jgi:hypothetical protein
MKRNLAAESLEESVDINAPEVVFSERLLVARNDTKSGY